MKITNNYNNILNFSGELYNFYKETPVDLTEILTREAEYIKIQPKEEADVFTKGEDGATDEIAKQGETEHTLGEMLIEIQTQRLKEEAPTQQPIIPARPIETGIRRLDIKG